MRAFRRHVAVSLLCLSTSSAFAGESTGSRCPAPAAVSASTRQTEAKSREAAHKGFTYLAKASTQWTKEHNCFGCHVQAVTMEALTAAKYFQYDVRPSDLAEMERALRMGVTAGGHTTGVAFEGAAWARFDRYIDDSASKELLRYADELMRLQATTGEIRDDDARLPVTGGTMQTTFQAAQTWRAAYARTANDKYLAPMRNAERYLTRTASAWKDSKSVYVQDLSFALLGLASAGVTRSEPASQRLQELLLSRQNGDGGWALDGTTSDAFATGQAVYALKVAGFSDGDQAVQRGVAFLLKQQAADGAWRTAKSGQNGSEKGETMWAVLGLVTVDVATISLKGLTDGQHVSGALALEVSAVDNQSGGIVELTMRVDDTPVQTSCGEKLAHSLDTSKLSAGKHVVDVVAVNAKGKQSRRRFEVFAGDVFLTEEGATFDDASQQTRISLRDIADPKVKGQVEVEVWSLDAKEAPKAKVFSTSLKAEPGAMQHAWDGRGADQKPQPRGRYVAKVSFKDEQGAVRQTESATFVHDTEAAQAQRYGQVEGNLKMGKLGIGSANTTVDLVDDDGKVLQSVRSTETGNYRFKSVTPGKYKVRVRKDGFAPQESPVETKANAPASKADVDL